MKKEKGDYMEVPNGLPPVLISERQIITYPTRNNNIFINFKFAPVSSHLLQVDVEVSHEISTYIYNETVHFFRKKQFDGFNVTHLPSEYIEETFSQEIIKKLNAYLFRHHIIDALMAEIMAQKIPYANYPRLTNIEFLSTKSVIFHFDLSLVERIELKEWKHFAFKTPRRKRYKDLDKQVMLFIEQEATLHKKNNIDTISESDWVFVETQLLDQDLSPIPLNLTSHFLVKIKKSEIPNQFRALLFGKKVGESFVSSHLDLEEDYDTLNNPYYNFLITIIAVIKGTCFSLETFKQSFKLKNKIEIHNKLMEVFSFRNDLSQRKTIIEEMFNLFLSKHRFEVPKHLVLRRQEDILTSIMQQPDYHVYKSQKDFLQQIETLSEKQLKEEVLIDQIAYQENIKIDLRDMQNYLHFFNNKRLKEFAYFKPAFEKIEEIDTPLNTSVLAQAVMREKTLNYILYTLTN